MRREKKGRSVCLVVCVCPGRLKCTKRHEQSLQTAVYIQPACWTASHFTVTSLGALRLAVLLQYFELISGISFLTKEKDKPCLSETLLRKKKDTIADDEFQLRKFFLIPACLQTHLHSGSSRTHARQCNPI